MLCISNCVIVAMIEISFLIECIHTLVMASLQCVAYHTVASLKTYRYNVIFVCVVILLELFIILW